MTRADADACAVAFQRSTGQPHVVYRFSAWPDGIFGVLPASRALPAEADIYDAPSAQGGLFG